MLVIKNATISSGRGDDTLIVNIWVEGEKIVEIENVGSGDFPVASLPRNDRQKKIVSRGGKGVKAETIDASNLLVLPGAIDPHVHYNSPGYERREDFEHGTAAAAAGGVTTVIDMPDICKPPVVNKRALNIKAEALTGRAHVDFALWAGVSRNVIIEENWIENMTELWGAGVVGFKSYILSGMDTFKDVSIIELGQVMQHAKRLGALIGLHAEEKELVKRREQERRDAGKNSIDDYYYARSDPAEKNGVSIGVQLAKQTHAKLHIVHLGSAGGLDVVRNGRTLGVDVSVETCPHFLEFTHEDFKKFGSLIKTAPVVKTKEDRAALWHGLEDGEINFIATDHAPCPPEEKNTGSAWDDWGGMAGTELMLPYLFSKACMKKRVTLSRLIELTSENAAKRFGLYPRKGAIVVGGDADLTFINRDNIWKVEGKKMHSKSKWTPMEGMMLNGKVIRTMVRGKVVFEDSSGVISKTNYGKWIKRLEK